MFKYYVRPDWNDVKQVFDDFDANTRLLLAKHSWVGIFFNWVVVALMVMMTFACAGWGINIHTERTAERLAAVAMADYQAEQEAIAKEEQQRQEEIKRSEQTLMAQETELIAKLLSGIQNFKDKYGYSENDFMTYAWCVFNRVDNQAYSNTVDEVVNHDNQWVGYSKKNEIITEYERIARKAVEEWHQNKSRPISSDFVYAELTEKGIFLKNEYDADGYSRRWRYGQ